MIIICIILLTIIFISFFIFFIFFSRKNKFDRISRKNNHPSQYKTANKEGRDYFETLNYIEYEIKSFDNLKLFARFLPGKFANKTIVCVHGYHSDDCLSDYGMTIRFLIKQGYNILLPDNRAHGKSEGTFTGFGVLDSIDINTWLNYLTKNLHQDEIIIYGISMGAATAINTLSLKKLPKTVKGLVSDCAFADGYEESAYQLKETYHLPAFPILNIGDFYLKIFAHYSLKDLKPKDSIKNAKIPILLIHGSNDHLIPPNNLEILFNNATCPKEKLLIPGASHGKSYLTNKKAYEEAFLKLLAKTRA